MSLTRLQKASLAELKAEQRAIEKGWVVSRPIIPCRYDLVLDAGQGRLNRAQVKYVGSEAKKCQGSVHFSANNGPHSPRCYDKSEVDVIVAYVPQIDQLIWIDPEYFDRKTGLNIRLRSTANGQRKGVFLAEDHIW